MKALVLESETSGLEALLERRRRSGLDRFDEVWGGVLHLVPAPSGPHGYLQHQLSLRLDGPARAAGLYVDMGGFNLGAGEGDYRVPDGGLHRRVPALVWYETAALVIEIMSPGDEGWEKLPFYAAHQVDEVLIVDPAERQVHWLGLQGDEYQPIGRSALIALGPEELAANLDWS